MKNSFSGYKFEKLDVWRIAIDIITEIYKITSNFPDEERFGLTSQFRRAATSIALNIAEGSGQPTAKGFILYIERSKASVLECVACEKIAIKLGYINKASSENLCKLLETEYFKLIGLKKSLK